MDTQSTTPFISKIDLFKELGNFDQDAGTSRVVDTNEFVNKYNDLGFGNGAGWARLDGTFGCKYKICTVKENGVMRFSWDPSNVDMWWLNWEFSRYSFTKKGNSIKLIKMCGLQDCSMHRSIPKWIKDIISKKTCVVCGSNSGIETDHKNGLYNDTTNLTLADFQPLCKHCNDQKRQTCVWQKENKKRYPATMIPMLSAYGVDFIQGDETYDETQIDALVGTFWYDPVEFMKSLLLVSR